MEPEFNLEEYMSHGVENIMKNALKATLSNPKESVFMTKFALTSRKASKLRHEAEENGEHIPPFLIASITSSCNLHCAGCYSRAIDSCNDCVPEGQLDGETWGRLFREAADLGITFVFLAGGEPLLRKDVIMEATKVPEVLFPVITNGTLLKGEYLDIFDKNRNLVPVLSIEGNQKTTDSRRGEGVFSALEKTMNDLDDRGILFGASITVTTENLEEVYSREFVGDLYRKGCKLVIYIEFVSVADDTGGLAPGDGEREIMSDRQSALRSEFDDMIFVSFPGDERAAGGCLAAGRGFFHINSHGGAEPCPFSPYSDSNVREVGLQGALHSDLFRSLTDSELLSLEHSGGCALASKGEEVESMLSR
ncbi:MAG: radical SAM protein [Oscillospiraceae bacterium]|nr:radical SAM protein [Oscillospiraceae bacterium]